MMNFELVFRVVALMSFLAFSLYARADDPGACAIGAKLKDSSGNAAISDSEYFRAASEIEEASKAGKPLECAPSSLDALYEAGRKELCRQEAYILESFQNIQEREGGGTSDTTWINPYLHSYFHLRNKLPTSLLTRACDETRAADPQLKKILQALVAQDHWHDQIVPPKQAIFHAVKEQNLETTRRELARFSKIHAQLRASGAEALIATLYQGPPSSRVPDTFPGQGGSAVAALPALLQKLSPEDLAKDACANLKSAREFSLSRDVDEEVRIALAEVELAKSKGAALPCASEFDPGKLRGYQQAGRINHVCNQVAEIQKTGIDKAGPMMMNDLIDKLILIPEGTVLPCAKTAALPLNQIINRFGCLRLANALANPTPDTRQFYLDAYFMASQRGQSLQCTIKPEEQKALLDLELEGSLAIVRAMIESFHPDSPYARRAEILAVSDRALKAAANAQTRLRTPVTQALNAKP